jgi:hypothetical protein
MIEELRRARLDRHARALLREQLSAGPWLWPAEPEGMRRALSVLAEGPPALQPGQTLLASVHPCTTSLWALRLPQVHGPHPAGQRLVPFGPRSRRDWQLAASVLPRSVPVLWQAVHALGCMPLEAVWLSSLAEPGCVEVRESVLDGASFGLSLCLAMASLVFERALPAELAASAEVGEDGALGAVEGLQRKAELLMEHAPCVRRLLVAAPQAPELRGWAGDRLQVIGVRTVAEALEQAYGGELSLLLLEAGRDEARRAELVRAFFRLAISGRAATVDWTPVARAAGLAAEHWAALNDEQREELAFVRMVAARHEGSAAGGKLPAARWLAGLAAPVRLDVIAHVLQQAADTGQPKPEAALRLATQWLVRGQDAFVQHLRLLGAVGRLRAVTGAADEALAMQTEAARGLLERNEGAELSYPLAEMYRLSGALGDGDAFEEAEKLGGQAAQLPGLQAEPYVTLARARALVMLGRGAEAKETLARLADDALLPAHVRGSSVRWLVRLLEGTGQREPADVRWLQRAQGGRAAAGGRYGDLIELDRALRGGQRDQAAEAVASMRRREPGLLDNLLGSARGEEAPGAWIARFYPY